MRPGAKIGLTILGKLLWTAGLALIVGLSAGAQEDSGLRGTNRNQPQVRANAILPEPVSSAFASKSLPPVNRMQVTRYLMNYEGDHSLDVATVVERVFSGYANYTVHLHLASGAEQSIAVTAPPGGLQLEMHDLTGDKVPNDLVLRPTLIHWLPTVLVNDGHDHFAIVISNHFPDLLSCGQDLQLRESEARTSAALMSSGHKARGFATNRELFPQLREITIVSSSERIVSRLDLSTNSGRAPPAVPTSI